MFTSYIMKKGECKMQKDKLIKIGGIVLTLAGAGISLATSMLEDKKLDAKVTEKVAEALTKNE